MIELGILQNDETWARAAVNFANVLYARERDERSSYLYFAGQRAGVDSVIVVNADIHLITTWTTPEEAV